MIHKVEGDLLLSKAHAVAHGVAPNDNFGQGLALALREQWPAMYKDFRHYCHQSHPDPGELWTWGGPGVRIINLMTQEAAYDHGSRPGKASTSSVNKCLGNLCKEIESEGFTSVALPQLATGVGGLEWREVQPLIESHLAKLPINVYVYTKYIAGQQAEEPGL